MSMINYVKGDATWPPGDGKKIIVHCCNDVGAWGAGFVMAISARWKAPEEAYRAWIETGEASLGDVQIVNVEPDLWVANLIGQHGVGSRRSDGYPFVRYDAIRSGFMTIAAEVNAGGFRGATIHMPRLGCGLAGGSWEHIEPLLDVFDMTDVYVYDL